MATKKKTASRAERSPVTIGELIAAIEWADARVEQLNDALRPVIETRLEALEELQKKCASLAKDPERYRTIPSHFEFLVGDQRYRITTGGHIALDQLEPLPSLGDCIATPPAEATEKNG